MTTLLQADEAALECCVDGCLNAFSHCAALGQYGRLGRRRFSREESQMLEDSAEICRTTAWYLMRRSPRGQAAARLCAEICEEAAGRWGAMADRDPLVEACASACRKCVTACRALEAG